MVCMKVTPREPPGPEAGSASCRASPLSPLDRLPLSAAPSPDTFPLSSSATNSISRVTLCDPPHPPSY